MFYQKKFLELLQTFRFCFKVFGRKRNVLLSSSRTLQTFLFCFKVLGIHGNVPLKILEHNETFWFRFNVFGINRNVTFLIKNFLEHTKRFGFVSILRFDIGTFVHSFRYRAGQEVDHEAGRQGKR